MTWEPELNLWMPWRRRVISVLLTLASMMDGIVLLATLTIIDINIYPIIYEAFGLEEDYEQRKTKD